MARKITEEAVSAFIYNRPFKKDNTEVRDRTLYLYGSAIARYDEDGRLWVTTARYDSRTTRERLNGLPGVRVYSKRGQRMVNDQPWDGGWTKIGEG